MSKLLVRSTWDRTTFQCMPPNAPPGWFVNICTDFGAFSFQIRFLYALISVPIFANYPEGSFGGSGSHGTNRYFFTVIYCAPINPHNMYFCWLMKMQSTPWTTLWEMDAIIRTKEVVPGYSHRFWCLVSPKSVRTYTKRGAYYHEPQLWFVFWHVVNQYF